MIGPETMSPVSAASTGTAAFGVGGVDAALVTAGAVVSVLPQPAARRAAPKAIGTIRLRILRLHRVSTNPASTTLWNTATKTAAGITHRLRGTNQCELCRGLPCPLEWPHRHWALPREHKKRVSREGSPLWG